MLLRHIREHQVDRFWVKLLMTDSVTPELDQESETFYYETSDLFPFPPMTGHRSQTLYHFINKYFRGITDKQGIKNIIAVLLLYLTKITPIL